MAIKQLSYKNSIVRALYFSGVLSCTELSGKIGKSYTLVVRTIEEMLQDGLVEERGYALSSGGRRSMTYGLPKDAIYSVGVAMDQFVTRIAILDVNRMPVSGIHTFELLLQDNPAAASLLANAINEVVQGAVREKGIALSRIAGIGIGMPGFINTEIGTNYTFLGEGIREYLKQQTGLTVLIENDSTTIGLAEFKFGAVLNKRHALVVNLGWGIGLGMILDGKIFRGDSGFAGEFSHIPVFKNGKLCSCGKIGCLETEASLLFMIERAVMELEAGRASMLKLDILLQDDYELKSSHFLQKARAGDLLAIEIISDVAYNIGRGISILVHLFNPSTVLLSGRCSVAGALWLPSIKRALNEYCIPRLLSNTTIEMSDLMHQAELTGAAALVYEHLSDAAILKFLSPTG